MRADMDLALVRFARPLLGQPFAWGSTNCVALALRWLDELGQTDILPRHVRHMSSERRAQAWVRKHGLDGLVGILRAEGLCVLPPAYAQPGEVYFCTQPGSGMVGAHIVLGTGKLLSSTPELGVAVFAEAALQAPELAVGWRADKWWP